MKSKLERKCNQLLLAVCELSNRIDMLELTRRMEAHAMAMRSENLKNEKSRRNRYEKV